MTILYMLYIQYVIPNKMFKTVAIMYVHCRILIVPLDMKGCICHFAKWQIHPFISEGTILYRREHSWQLRMFFLNQPTLDLIRI